MSSEELFNLKYNENIYNLFQQHIQYLNYNNIYTKHKDHMDLFYFIYEHCHVHYDTDSSDEENEQENNISNYYKI